MCSGGYRKAETAVVVPRRKGAPRSVSDRDIRQMESKRCAEYGPRKRRPSLEKTQEALGRLSSGDSDNTGSPSFRPWRAGSAPGSSPRPCGQSRRLSGSKPNSSPRKMTGEPEWRSLLSRDDVSCGVSSFCRNSSTLLESPYQSLLSLPPLSRARYALARASFRCLQHCKVSSR